MSAIQITAQLTGGETFLAADGAALVRSAGQKLALQLAQAVIDRATPDAPVDTGKLAGSGMATPTSDGAVAAFTAPYASDVEHGTPPHDVSIAELVGWAGRHDMRPGAVRNAIAKRGTKAQPYFAPAVQDVMGLAPQMAADAANDLRTALMGGN